MIGGIILVGSEMGWDSPLDYAQQSKPSYYSKIKDTCCIIQDTKVCILYMIQGYRDMIIK